jgi:hypothetical protein
MDRWEGVLSTGQAGSYWLIKIRVVLIHQAQSQDRSTLHFQLPIPGTILDGALTVSRRLELGVWNSRIRPAFCSAAHEPGRLRSNSICGCVNGCPSVRWFKRVILGLVTWCSTETGTPLRRIDAQIKLHAFVFCGLVAGAEKAKRKHYILRVQLVINSWLSPFYPSKDELDD